MLASLQGLDRDARVIYVGTLTKVTFPTLRLGFAVIPEDLTGRSLDIRNPTDTVSTSVQQQMAMTDFNREDHFSRHIKRTLYLERHKTVVEAVQAEADETVEAVGDRAELHVMALLPSGIDDVELADAANRRGIPVGPLSPCYVRPAGRAGLRLGYANLDARQIPEHVRSLKPLIERRGSRRGELR